MARDIKQEVTDSILASLEDGVAPWVRPWQGGGYPTNGKTKKQYRGVNLLLLIGAQIKHGYATAEWMTYKQAKSMGAQVRKGQAATMVVFWKMMRSKDDEDKTYPLLRYYHVFNRDQIDGLPALPGPDADFDPNQRAEDLIEAFGSQITYGGGRACYMPLTDEIRHPVREAFDTPEAFYATNLHEHIHWSGAKKRLGRQFGSKGTAEYAFEELVAELGAAFTCAEVGIAGKLQHAEYIGSWIERLQNDKNAIFSAASLARKSSDFLLGFESQEDEAEEAA